MRSYHNRDHSRIAALEHVHPWKTCGHGNWLIDRLANLYPLFCCGISQLISFLSSKSSSLPPQYLHIPHLLSQMLISAHYGTLFHCCEISEKSRAGEKLGCNGTLNRQQGREENGFLEGCRHGVTPRNFNQITSPEIHILDKMCNYPSLSVPGILTHVCLGLILPANRKAPLGSCRKQAGVPASG